MTTNLFFSNKSKQYYSNKIRDCDNCKQEVYGVSILHTYYTKKGIIEKIICYRCVDKYKFDIISYAEDKINLIINEIIPTDCVPVFIRHPNFKSGEISVYDIKGIDKKYKDSPNITIDKTKLAGRESFEGAIVGDMSKVLEQDNKKNELLEKKGVKYLIDATER